MAPIWRHYGVILSLAQVFILSIYTVQDRNSIFFDPYLLPNNRKLLKIKKILHSASANKPRKKRFERAFFHVKLGTQSTAENGW